MYDIDKNQIRITILFKEYFPSIDMELKININAKEFYCSFKKRIGRSDILRLGKAAMEELKIKSGQKIQFTKISFNNFHIEKI